MGNHIKAKKNGFSYVISCRFPILAAPINFPHKIQCFNEAMNIWD